MKAARSVYWPIQESQCPQSYAECPGKWMLPLRIEHARSTLCASNRGRAFLRTIRARLRMTREGLGSYDSSKTARVLVKAGCPTFLMLLLHVPWQKGGQRLHGDPGQGLLQATGVLAIARQDDEALSQRC